tara:strand:- start:548 stop:937 length:390 start_codon:yes stop_codon:yes gene_type:complete
MVIHEKNSGGIHQPLFEIKPNKLIANRKLHCPDTLINILANSDSLKIIDCKGYKSIKLYGTSTTLNSINLTYNDKILGKYKKVSKELKIINIGGDYSFFLEIDITPNYIGFYNNNPSIVDLTLSYILYS